MAKGNYSIRYDPDKLRKMIEDGKTAKEIGEEFSISPYTLREHLVMLQNLDKKIYVVEGLFDYSKEKTAKVKKLLKAFGRKITQVSRTEMPPLGAGDPGGRAFYVRCDEAENSSGFENFEGFLDGFERAGHVLDNVDHRDRGIMVGGKRGLFKGTLLDV